MTPQPQTLAMPTALFTRRVEAARLALQAAHQRAELAAYLLGLDEEYPMEESTVNKVASYTFERVREQQGFLAEQVAHINAELSAIEELDRQAARLLNAR